MRTNTERFALWGALGVLGAVGLGGAGGLQSAVERTRGPSAGVAVPAAAADSDRLALEAARGELAVAQLRIERAEAIIGYSTRYHITADLAAAIYDLALAEGIDPALAFSLVKTESNFTLCDVVTCAIPGVVTKSMSSPSFLKNPLSRATSTGRS